MYPADHGANIAIARTFPWKDYRSYVDVGTAQGDLATQIALANGHLQGFGFDLPEVAPIFEEYVARLGVADRVTFVAGSFFDNELPNTDVVLMILSCLKRSSWRNPILSPTISRMLMMRNGQSRSCAHNSR